MYYDVLHVSESSALFVEATVDQILTILKSRSRTAEWVRPLIISSVVTIASFYKPLMELLMLALIVFFSVWFPRAMMEPCPIGMKPLWWNIERSVIFAMMLLFVSFMTPIFVVLWNAGAFNPFVPWPHRS